METRYKRMLKQMAAKESPADPPDWSVYIVSCADGSYYTGIAKDVGARVAKHNSGKGAAYTRARRPVELLYAKDGMTRSAALAYEAKIKSLPRREKLRQLWGQTPKLPKAGK